MNLKCGNRKKSNNSSSRQTEGRRRTNQEQTSGSLDLSQFPHSRSSIGQWWPQKRQCHTCNGNASPHIAQIKSMHVNLFPRESARSRPIAVVVLECRIEFVKIDYLTSQPIVVLFLRFNTDISGIVFQSQIRWKIDFARL